MAKKLIATEFGYTLCDEFGKESTTRGSYLGRKVASVKTLRAFVNANVKRFTPNTRLVHLVPFGSYVSQWIAK